MINYIVKKPDNKIYISKGNDYFIKDMPLTKYFNNLLQPYFSTLNAREKTTKKIFKFKSKIPILINDKNLLMTIKSYRSDDSLFVNYYSIYKFSEINNEIIITFYNGHEMKITEKYSFHEQYKRCEKIVNYVNY